MDPLSIVSGIIAICQAGERIGGLIFCIQTLANAPAEIAAFVDEISNLLSTLSELHSRILSSHEAFESSRYIHQVLEACLGRVGKIEGIIANSLTASDKLPFESGLSTTNKTKRMAWLRKRKKIERVKQELKVALSAIHLELLSLSMLVLVLSYPIEGQG